MWDVSWKRLSIFAMSKFHVNYLGTNKPTDTSLLFLSGEQQWKIPSTKQSRRWKIKRIDRVQSTSLTNRDYFRSTFILRFAYYEATMKCALEFQDPSVSCITRTGHKSQVRTVLHKSITISVPMSRNGAVSSRFRNETSHRSATISCPVYHETLSRNSCRPTVEQLIQ